VVLVGGLVDQALDGVLLGRGRVTSAAEGKRLLARPEETEELTGSIQRVVVVAVPVVRTLLRGARVTKVPWVLIASSAVSVGVAVRAGVRELQVLSSLVAHRVEQATGAPADPALVKRLTVDLYLEPKRAPGFEGKLRLGQVTRKWVVLGTFGRTTAKRAAKALDAAERLDAAALAASWRSRRP
jgi:hypothetical protein